MKNKINKIRKRNKKEKISDLLEAFGKNEL